MISNKIDGIIDMLIKSTNSGDLVWEMVSKNEYDSERKFRSRSEDGESTFEMSVKYRLSDDKWVLEKDTGLWIYNATLPGGSMYAGYGYKKNADLRDVLLKIYCGDMSPSSKVVEDKLDNIIRNISKKEHRDNILTNIFKWKKTE